jgi:hypothetical protein
MGYDHYIALGCSRAHCDVMHAAWPAPGQPLSCAFSSEPFKSHPAARLDSEWQRYLVMTQIGKQTPATSTAQAPDLSSCTRPNPSGRVLRLTTPLLVFLRSPPAPVWLLSRARL